MCKIYFLPTHAQTYVMKLVEWPSGLRRQVKALISSEARVRIPSQPIYIYYFIHTHARIHILVHNQLSPLSSEGRALAF